MLPNQTEAEEGSVSSRLIWSTQQVPGQPGVNIDTLIKYKQINNKKD